MNNKQREVVATFFIDIAKAILAVFFIGGLVPNSPITIYHICTAILVALSLFVGSMRILRGYKND